MNVVQNKCERSSKRGSTAARHQDLHDRLVGIAEAAIATEGLAGLRARALAEAAGCSVGAIYGVFADLDMLVLAVNVRTLEALDTVMGRAADAAGPGGAADAGPAGHLARLAEAYLDYAAANRPRWDALFQHRMAEGRPIPPWYAERLEMVFRHVEAPLSALQPGLPAGACATLARTVFAAVHGMVGLGLDGKVAAMTLPVLRGQVRMVVGAIASGLQG